MDKMGPQQHFLLRKPGPYSGTCDYWISHSQTIELYGCWIEFHKLVGVHGLALPVALTRAVCILM